MTDVRLTTGELTQRTGVEEHQLREWQELGLLRPDAEGSFDTDAVERVRLIRFAVRRGVPAADIARLSEAQGDDVLARYIDFLGGPRPAGCSLVEAARLAGLPEALARRLWVAGGLGEDEIFDDDVEMMRAAADAVRLGLPEEALLQIIRVLADALGRVADAENRLFHLYVHEPLRDSDLPQEKLVETVRGVGEPLRELIQPSILYFHRRAWTRAQMEDMVIHLREDLDPHRRQLGEVPVAVLFVDLASFTPLTEAMGDAEAAKVLDRFSDLVREAAARCDGRVLKQIGDEFMVVFPSGAAAVTCGLDIAGLVHQEPQFPAVRQGAHSGTALYREADYLGATVNLAARVASEAGRGQFLVTEAARAEAGDLAGVRFEPVGRRALKGVAEPLELFVVTPRHTDAAPRVVDPVCGMELAQDQCDIHLSWQGGDVFFCSEACRELFLEAPERYPVRR
jgi:class 3 adenylate cyclase/DNA-binding transcriptional MerR regulator